jgi:hypothetical protein
MSKPLKKPQRSREELLRIAQVDEHVLPKLPDPPEGYVYRWVRVILGGKDDIQNISRYQRGGWEFVKPEELEGKGFPVRDFGKLEGIIGINDVALAKLPEDIRDARIELADGRAKGLEASVKHQLGQLQDSRMPIHNESKSTTRRGKEARFE